MQPLRGSQFMVPFSTQASPSSSLSSPSGGSLGYYTMKPLRGFTCIVYIPPNDLRLVLSFPNNRCDHPIQIG